MMRWAVPVLLLAAGAAAAQDVELRFDVTLDDRPIGTHVFRIAGPPSARTVDSEAAFRVQLLGLTLYRYRHRATEQWRGKIGRAHV